MNITMTYRWTRSLYSAFVRQFFWRGQAIYLILLAVVAAAVCLVFALVIAQLYRFFSSTGVVDAWYHILVTLPVALFPAPILVKLIKRVIKFKRDYTRLMHESCPIHDDGEIDVKVKIDCDGICLGKKRVLWEEMTVGFTTKDFYVFMSDSPVLIGLPKFPGDEKLAEYLVNEMRMIKSRLINDRRRKREGRESLSAGKKI